MAARSFRGRAVALVPLALSLCSGVHFCLLLHGNGRAVFRGSVGRLTGPGWGKLCEEPCEILDFRSQEGLWSLRLRDKRTLLAEGSEEQGFHVDHCVLPGAFLEGVAVRKEVRLTATALAGKALEATVELPRNCEVFRELPFLVAERSDLPARSRLAAFRALQAQPEREELQSAFEELTTGGLEEQCREDAADLAESETSSLEIARVLARWQCNSQRMSVPRGASGLYRLHSFLQHSCAPNCAVGVLFSTGEVLVRAIKDICEGELLTRNYEREAFLELPASERQQHLLQTRGFACLCERCAKESGEKRLEYGGRLMADSDKSAQVSSSCDTCQVQEIYDTEMR